MVMVPVAFPGAVGSKLTWRVSVCPGLTVAGKVGPVIENPAPVIVADWMLSDAVPDEVRVRLLVSVVFRETSPKPIELSLIDICADWSAGWTATLPQPQSAHAKHDRANTNQPTCRRLPKIETNGEPVWALRISEVRTVGGGASNPICQLSLTCELCSVTQFSSTEVFQRSKTNKHNILIRHRAQSSKIVPHPVAETNSSAPKSWLVAVLR
jgi:hypothetical protein